jgi:hypothetical protein
VKVVISWIPEPLTPQESAEQSPQAGENWPRLFKEREVKVIAQIVHIKKTPHRCWDGAAAK